MKITLKEREIKKMKKLFSFLVLFLISYNMLYSQVTPPTLSAGEYWTNCWSLSYDYQTNGSVRYIVQDPSNPRNLCAIFMGTRDSSSPAGTNRYVWYSYSANGGVTWDPGAQVEATFASGFPCLTVRDGNPLVAFHEAASPTSAKVYEDLVWGAGVFSTVGTVPNSPNTMVWPHLCVTTNNNIVVVAAPNPGFTAQVTYYSGSTWSAETELTNTGGPSGNFSTEAGPGSSAFVFGIDYNSAATSGNRLWTTNNNGVAFTLQTGANAPPDFLTDATDTMYSFIDGGRDGIYKGSEIHLVYTVYANSAATIVGNTTWYPKCKIIHWSPSTGVDTVAGRYNMPNMTDTITQQLVTPLCQPSVGVYGNLLYVTYTAYLRGNTQTVDNGDVVNAGEIFITYSADNGNTWSTPVNITNTPNREEKHSSVVRNFTLASGDSVGVYYIRDMKAGGWVNNAAWGPAPVYGIYKKLGGSVIGIKQESEVVNRYELFQNYPNPFNPTTTITYYMQKNGNATLKVYNVLGDLVATLVDGYQTKGAKEISFDGTRLASGIYFYTISAGDFTQTKKMMLVK